MEATSEPLAAFFFAGAAIQLGISLLVLFTHPRRIENQLVALILGLSGGSSAARAYNALVPDDFGARNVPFALEWGVSFLVLALALHYPHRHVRSRVGRLALAAGGAGVAVLWAIAIVDPSLYGYVLWSPATRPAYSWTTVLVDDFRYWTTLLPALALFAFAAARHGSVAGQYAFIAFVFGPLTSFNLGLTRLAVTGQYPDLPPLSLVRSVINLGGTLLAIALTLALAWALRKEPRRLKSLLLWAGAALALSQLNGPLNRLETAVGFGWGELGYILVRPLVLGYALFRHQVFDVDVRVKRSFAAGVLVVAVAALFLPTVEVVRRFSGLPGDMGLMAGMAVGIGVVLALHVRVEHFAQGASARVFARVNEDDSRYLEEKKREVYRAALVRGLDARLNLTPRAEAELAEMRTRFGISSTEHESLAAEARETAARTPRRDDGHEHSAASPGAVLLARYRVLALIGEGGSAWTYRCGDARLGREVAVKEVRVDERASGLREARLLASVHHPRVVTLYEVHESGSRAFLVMELMRESLADVLARKGTLAPAEARAAVIEALQGLEALHAAGLVHRDLKPSNVLLDSAGHAKVADLGIARVENAGTTRSGLARAGTPAYMAPEQVLGTGVDARTDVYAAAAVLYEALAGETYVRIATREGRLVEEAIVSLPPPLPLDGAPRALNEWMARGLAKDPAQRFASAREAREALAATTLTPEP